MEFQSRVDREIDGGLYTLSFIINIFAHTLISRFCASLGIGRQRSARYLSIVSIRLGVTTENFYVNTQNRIYNRWTRHLSILKIFENY